MSSEHLAPYVKYSLAKYVDKGEDAWTQQPELSCTLPGRDGRQHAACCDGVGCACIATTLQTLMSQPSRKLRLRIMPADAQMCTRSRCLACSMAMAASRRLCMLPATCMRICRPRCASPRLLHRQSTPVQPLPAATQGRQLQKQKTCGRSCSHWALRQRLWQPVTQQTALQRRCHRRWQRHLL